MMKRILIILWMVVFVVGEPRADEPPFKYATLDYEYVIQQSKAFLDMEKKIENKRKILFNEAQNKEKSLNTQRAELEKKCPTTTKAECEAGMRSNTEAFNQLNNTYRSQRSSLNESFAKVTSIIEDNLAIAVEELVQRHKYTVVFHKRMLIYSANSDDITKKALDLLNEKMPTSGL